MKAKLLKLLVKPIGNLLLGIVSAAVAAGVSQLAQLNPDLAAQVDAEAVAMFVWGAIMWTVNGWINAQLTRGPRLVQQSLNDQSRRVGGKIAEDGIILPDGETARQLERLTGLPVRRAERP